MDLQLFEPETINDNKDLINEMEYSINRYFEILRGILYLKADKKHFDIKERKEDKIKVSYGKNNNTKQILLEKVYIDNQNEVPAILVQIIYNGKYKRFHQKDGLSRILIADKFSNLEKNFVFSLNAYSRFHKLVRFQDFKRIVSNFYNFN